VAVVLLVLMLALGSISTCAHASTAVLVSCAREGLVMSGIYRDARGQLVERLFLAYCPSSL
jgi:hypothetical protein